MSLPILFDPVSPDLLSGFEHYSYLNQRIRVFTEIFPEWTKADIAIIGLVEDRGNPDNEGAFGGADAMRRALYGLRASHIKYNVVDLGNLRAGETVEDSYLRLKEVVRTLLESNVIPLVIGGTHDHTLPMVWAYEELGRKIGLLNVDSRSDTEPSVQQGMAQHHISKILTKHKECLSLYIHLAYQTYLVDENILAAIEQHHHFKMRLGELREDIKAIEPIVRSADFLSFDLSAVRISEAPANAGGFPFGLTGEEACQIAWYAGCNSKLTSFGLFELNPGLDYRETTSQMAATMLWYFIEGFYHRKDDLTFSQTSYMKYRVPISNSADESLIFYKGLLSNNWWVESSTLHSDSEGVKVPCAEQDYLKCLHGEVPNRWINQALNLSM